MIAGLFLTLVMRTRGSVSTGVVDHCLAIVGMKHKISGRMGEYDWRVHGALRLRVIPSG